jgi:hypothetical protein
MKGIGAGYDSWQHVETSLSEQRNRQIKNENCQL